MQIDKDGNLLQIRPTYGGKILATIISPNIIHRWPLSGKIFIEKKQL